MRIRFACPCGKQLQARDEHAGRKTRCPDCGETLVVPAGSGEALAAASAPHAEYDPVPDLSATVPLAATASPMPAAGPWIQDDDPPPAAKVPAPPPLPSVGAAAPAFAIPPSHAVAREPWSFTLVDQYAVAARNCVLAVSGLLIALGGMGFAYRLYELFSAYRAFGRSLWDLLPSAGFLTLAFLLSVALFLLIFVLPIMLFLAMLHITVDGARSLRAIRAVLERRG